MYCKIRIRNIQCGQYSGVCILQVNDAVYTSVQSDHICKYSDIYCRRKILSCEYIKCLFCISMHYTIHLMGIMTFMRNPFIRLIRYGCCRIADIQSACILRNGCKTATIPVTLHQYKPDTCRDFKRYQIYEFPTVGNRNSFV